MYRGVTPCFTLSYLNQHYAPADTAILVMRDRGMYGSGYTELPAMDKGRKGRKKEEEEEEGLAFEWSFEMGGNCDLLISRFR